MTKAAGAGTHYVTDQPPPPPVAKPKSKMKARPKAKPKAKPKAAGGLLSASMIAKIAGFGGGGGGGYRRRGGSCYKCGRSSHFANQCFARTTVFRRGGRW